LTNDYHLYMKIVQSICFCVTYITHILYYLLHFLRNGVENALKY